ncbi:Di-copper centre-containing protein, partial [Basidiobolus meristosporus CBS 931.73]
MKVFFACITLLALGLLEGVHGQAGKCSRIRVRKEIRQMTDNERNAYLRAINELKKRNKYEQFAYIHSTYEVYAHGTPDFFPWHRQFLLNFENALREIDPSINIPYWDWTIESQSPETSIIFKWYGGNGQGRSKCVVDGAFARWTLSYPNRHCLQRSFDEGNKIGSFYSAEVINAIQDTNDDFDDFRQSFESGPHGQVHNGISGDMKKMISPNDPIFWLHHGFVDKVYYDWQLRGPEFVNKYNG